jgi:hypothetical protein
MPRKLAHVSARKIAANRQNALKSTGPKTSRGKANSRTNALKHGLFAMDLCIASLTKWEDPDEYQKLLDRLTDSYQPVGAAEELEVQQIAVCWWKRSRAWRYENAEIAIQLCKKHAELSKWETLSSEDQARLATLKNATMEIEAAGELSEELKQKIFADAEFQKLWDFAGEELNELLARRLELPLTVINKVRDSRPDTNRNFLLGTSRRASLIIERERVRLAAESESSPTT